ncbi:hypothetical protein HanRHA438_Chr13g0607011 [Helianthus annuus]|nr:hypothetical protein HanIR_Chr13g0648731 [Helianthus annuus]KAJ0858957.1 hypothetical protein HanRHA438_Chr13g0607011 [Helianthus annuus]
MRALLSFYHSNTINIKKKLIDKIPFSSLSLTFTITLSTPHLSLTHSQPNPQHCPHLEIESGII